MLNKKKSGTIFLKNLAHLPGIYYFLLKSVRKQKRFLKKELEPELESFRRENDGSLTEADFKKISSYYAMGVPAILGDSLCVLRGFPLTEKERLCMSYLGGISGLLDDLFDDPGKSADHLMEFICHPEKGIPRNTHEGLLQHMYLKGLSLSPHCEKIKIMALEVFKAQQKSLAQKGDGEKNVIQVTFLKGGNSFLYYRLCLFHPLEEKEKEMIFQLGGLMQLGNDIFDIWEDCRDGISTIATTTISIQQLRSYFVKELNKTLLMAANTRYNSELKRKFQRIINLAIARVFICLDQYQKLELDSEGNFQPMKYSRKQLICDMEQRVSQLKAIHYYLNSPVI